MRTLTTNDERAVMVPAAVRKVLGLLNAAGEARIAGGAVRDSLLGVEPKDWDVATTLTPEAVIAVAERARIPVRFNDNSLDHGTVTLHVDGMDVEVTTLRVDKVTDGRHAEVEFTDSWLADADRRDLTFNAMFMSADGQVFDYHSGTKDLLEGRVRFVGCASARIQEDYLRILRFFRFASRMACDHFDCEAMRAIKRNVHGLEKISGERIWMEMSKILVGPVFSDVLARMVGANVLSALGFKDVDMHHAIGANMMNGRPETVLGALLASPEAVERAADDWSLSRKERDMAVFVAGHMDDRVKVWQWGLHEWQRMCVAEGRDRTLELMSLTDKVGWKEDVMATWEIPVFPLSGNDLIGCGVKPGPEMGRKLKAAKEAWMDSHFTLAKRKLLQLACAA